MKHCLSVLVENKPGALTRITTMFARRGFNIDSLAVGPTERHDISRITLTVDADEHSLSQIQKQMHKLVNVLRITELPPGERLERELALFKVAAPPERRAELTALRDVFAVRVVDVGQRRPRLRDLRDARGGRRLRGARPPTRNQGGRAHGAYRARPRLDRVQSPHAARPALKGATAWPRFTAKGTSSC